ncbi:hypothetical protein F7018_11470 [Tenacibaculum aiptasiae]|uniref:Uncharacterized protein n=1 Tax=Tenacibaculum aiptasiae TaxID=426481 RepID=A0A7J5AEB6_9FLAO|nr:hypothetical protein [Tenacibaculum aiptasiae]KAB1155921.1 hypothetical protein F7018_11470 [Tenacibaculum aiptasiae]
MNKIINILTTGIQLGTTFILTVCIYMAFAILDYESGFDSFIGLALFQSAFAIILSILTIFCCLILGLPIRLINKLNNWWTKHFYFAILLTFVGLILLGLSLTPNFTETTTITRNELKVTKKIPNSGLVITGWILTAFSTLHIYPPNQLTSKAKDILTKLTGRKTKTPKTST